MTPERLIGGALALVALGAFGVLGWLAQRAGSPGRALDPGDFVVFGVFAIFGALCTYVGWRLFRIAPSAVQEPPPEANAVPSKRITASRICAAIGVSLLILCVVLPERWYPVLFLFVGLAFLVVSHVLTPCVERLEQLKKARQSLRQL